MSDLAEQCHIDKGTYTDGPVLTKDVRDLFDRIDELDKRNKILEDVHRCAKGLCHGEDWNGGTAALYYRKPLKEAVAALEASDE